MNSFLSYENSNGESIILDKSFPFFLTEYEGIHEKVSELSGIASAFSVGEFYIGRNVPKRNIVINGYIKKDFYENRQKLYRIFNDNDEGTLYYHEDDKIVKIKCRTEKVNFTEVPPIMYFTISLMCFNPFFEDEVESKSTISQYTGGIEFPFEIVNDEIEFETKNEEASVEIYNPTNIQSGLRIIFNFRGEVSKPTIKNIDTQEALTIDMDFQYGDKVEITTHINNKNIILTKNGKETNINNYLLFGTKFLQLNAGMNTFTIFAESGADHMDSELYYSIYYEAV